MEKKDRADWLNRQLSSKGIPEYGRAATIAKRIDCSNAVCQGWLQGSLPKDLKLALSFSREFDINLNEWVTGQRMSEADLQNMQDAVLAARRFEKEMGELTDDQFIMVSQLIYKNEQVDKGSIEQTLNVVASIVKGKNGTNGD